MPKARSPRLSTPPVKQHLRDAGYSFRQVGALLDCSVVRVSDMVNGHSRFSRDRAEALARLVGRPLDECFLPEHIARPWRRSAQR